jgi:excisionase family DNA binding protein
MTNLQTTPDENRLLTAEEVAAKLAVPESWVYRAARAGELPSVQLGRYRRFRWPDVERWMEDQLDAA